MRRLLMTSMLILLPSGCTHTQVIDRAAPGPDAFRGATATLQGREAVILTREGQMFRWYNVEVTPDSVFGLPVATGVRATGAVIPTERLVEATARSRSRGIVDGVLIGAGAGVLLGLIMPPDRSCVDYYGPCPSTRGQQAVLVGVGGAAWGLILGAIFPAKLKIQMR
jgi:hypothetical protein